MKTNLILLLSILCLASCKKEDDSIKINGEWIWEESTGGFAGWTLTPESANINRRLVIDNNTYKEFLNDSLILETGYELGTSDENLLGIEENTFIQFDSGRKQAIVISNSTLELIDLCFDCFRHRFKRN